MIIKRGIANLSEDVTENGYRNIINSRVEIYEKTEGNYTEVLSKLLSLTQETYAGGMLVFSDAAAETVYTIHPNASVTDVLNDYKRSNETVSFLEQLTQIS